MKLAPITTARRAVLALAMIARESLSEPDMDVRLVGAGNIETNGFGAGRQQQLIERDAARPV